MNFIDIDIPDSVNIFNSWVNKDFVVNWTDSADLVFSSHISSVSAMSLLKKSLQLGLLDDDYKDFFVPVNVIVTDEEIEKIISFIFTNEDGNGDILWELDCDVLISLFRDVYCVLQERSDCNFDPSLFMNCDND